MNSDPGSFAGPTVAMSVAQPGRMGDSPSMNDNNKDSTGDDLPLAEKLAPRKDNPAEDENGDGKHGKGMDVYSRFSCDHRDQPGPGSSQ